MSKPIQMERGVKYRDADKMALIPVKTVVSDRQEMLRKPAWMKIKLPADSTKIQGIKDADLPGMIHNALREGNPLYPVPVLMDERELIAMYLKLMTQKEQSA